MSEVRKEPDQPTDATGFASKKFGIFIIGAGFSRGAGLPLAPELWAEVLRRAKSMSGRASKFQDDLNSYITFKKECHGIQLTVEKVNFEDFIAFLDIEHYLGLRGSDTWSEDGNEAQVVVKTLIGEILTERTPLQNNLPEIYLRFAEMLQPGDIVLSFNYDVLLERALDEIAKPYRLFPSRYKHVSSGGAVGDDSREEVVVLKLHGSIDWFDRRQYGELEENSAAHGLSPGHFHPVFGPGQGLRTKPLVDGPRFRDDPLRETYRVLDIEKLYQKGILFHATPSILNPSSTKILYSQKLRDFWWGLGDAGILNFRMAIIGFSLSVQDDYACQVVYRLVRNYQSNYWGEEVLEHKKAPLIIVDLRKSSRELEEFHKRYAFVNWGRAETYFDGFDAQAIALLKRR